MEAVRELLAGMGADMSDAVVEGVTAYGRKGAENVGALGAFEPFTRDIKLMTSTDDVALAPGSLAFRALDRALRVMAREGAHPGTLVPLVAAGGMRVPGETRPFRIAFGDIEAMLRATDTEIELLLKTGSTDAEWEELAWEKFRLTLAFSAQPDSREFFGELWRSRRDTGKERLVSIGQYWNWYKRDEANLPDGTVPDSVNDKIDRNVRALVAHGEDAHAIRQTVLNGMRIHPMMRERYCAVVDRSLEMAAAPAP
jgi:hypothetical protein